MGKVRKRSKTAFSISDCLAKQAKFDVCLCGPAAPFRAECGRSLCHSSRSIRLCLTSIAFVTDSDGLPACLWPGLLACLQTFSGRWLDKAERTPVDQPSAKRYTLCRHSLLLFASALLSGLILANDDKAAANRARPSTGRVHSDRNCKETALSRPVSM